MSNPLDNEEDTLISVTIGHPFYRHVESGCQFNYFRPSLHTDDLSAPSCELVIGFDDPTPDEKAGFLNGVFETALFEFERIPFLCFRFSRMVASGRKVTQHYAIDWQECAVHPVLADGYVPPAPEEPYRWLVNMMLVDSLTQLVAALRSVTFGSEFCRIFSQTLQTHLEDFASPQEYMAKLHYLYDRHPVGEVIAKGRLLGHCLGGD